MFPGVGDRANGIARSAQLDVGLKMDRKLERGLVKRGQSPESDSFVRVDRTLVFLRAVRFSPTQLRISSRLCSSRPRSTLAISSQSSSSTRSAIPSSSARAMAVCFSGGLVR
jgi:hypothetical protein